MPYLLAGVNGSKMCGCKFSGMPMPVSLISIVAKRSLLPVVTKMTESSWLNLQELVIIFPKTLFIFYLLTYTNSGLECKDNSIV